MRRPLAELAALVAGRIEGDASVAISGVNALEQAQPGQLSFYGNPRYKEALAKTRASAVLVGKDVPARAGVAWVRVDNPHLAFARISSVYHPAPTYAPGIAAQASVHPEASVHPSATVMPFATVDKGAKVGARSVLYPSAYVGESASVGDDCVLYSAVTVAARCQVGDRVILHSSCVVGADGFGFAFDFEKPEHVKIPQAGIARVEDDVELGACACVDRATTGETVIGKGSKIDNLVQIAHNVTIGPYSIVCAQVGISGSAEIGTGVVLAGQVGVVGHIRVGDMAKIGAQSGVAQNVPDGAMMSGYPAMPHANWLKASVVAPKLGELLKEVRALRRRLDELEKKGQGA
ncbi:MAG: UDP-3-O-(3-hydroxymyristoyl)glucosamine N-acyltransferase [Myxococcaceae bacterium]|nr:UDP-3-O-(3-hydroxymyristoyl)glucosamine N-acyltransferase [Myxococcaceae bacterium]